MKKQLVLTIMSLGISFITQTANGADTPAATPNASAASAAVSSNDNYLGDCFHVYIKTKTSDGAVLESGWYLTLSQDNGNLNLLKIDSAGISCSPKDAIVGVDGYPINVQVKVHDLDGIAKRTGWVYGALVLPFKYHIDDKSFSGETSIGPYFGRRSTLGSSSFIWAITAGLTPLSVDSVDQNGNPKSTQLTAFTYAAGLMFEMNKGTSPFRAGIFYGHDVVSSDSAITYKHDRKNWLALQIAWDFVAK